MTYEQIATKHDELAALYRELADKPIEEPPSDPQPQPDPTPVPERSHNIGVNVSQVNSWDHAVTYANALKSAIWTEGEGSFAGKWSAPVGINAQLPIHKGRAYLFNYTGKARLPNVGRFDIPEEARIEFPQNLQAENVIFDNLIDVEDSSLMYPVHRLTDVFHEYFVNDLRPYKYLRFMDWTRTNGSIHRKWSDTPRTHDAWWTGPLGSPWKHALDLCQLLGSVPWINIPHDANEDYIQHLAELVKSYNFPEVYVEYSNECWNDAGAFKKQKMKCVRHAEEHGPSGLDWHEKKAWGYGKLAEKSFDIFFDATGNQLSNKFVLAWQAAANYSHRVAIEACGFGFDVIAIAPYIDLRDRDGVDEDEIFNLLKTSRLDAVKRDVNKYEELCNEYGKDLALYECGQHLVGDDASRLNQDERMGELYELYDKAIVDVAGDIPRCYYTQCGKDRRGTAFGIQSYSGQEGPKWQALRRLMGA